MSTVSEPTGHLPGARPRAGVRRSFAAAMVAAGLSSQTALIAQRPGPDLASTGDPTATATLERYTATIGDHLVLTVVLYAPGKVAETRPRIVDRLGEFDVLDVSPVETPGPACAWAVTLSSLEAGPRVIGALVVGGTYADGRPFVTAPTQPMTVTVTSPAVRADDALEPLTAPLGVPSAPWWLRTALTASAACLLGAVTWLVAVRMVLPWLRRRRFDARWRDRHAAIARLAGTPHLTAAPSRSDCHTAATVARDAVCEALGTARPSPATDDLLRELARRPEHFAMAETAASVLSGLDVGRFARDDDPRRDVDARTAISSAPTLLRVAEQIARAASHGAGS